MKDFKYILIFILFSACQSQTSSTAEIEKYYKLKNEIGLIVEELEQSDPEIQKLWQFQDKKEVKRVRIPDWKDELKAFSESDLNKSSFVTSYDSIVNQNEIIYQLKPDENLNIKKLTIRLDEDQKLVYIESIKSGENSFFSTGSKNILHAENGKLKEYEVLSTQKLLWFEADTSFVKGVRAND